ncbi:hypothetical protein [Aliivibrio fischeri]|uniref:hypothetical protein n=1 Tax=Aliivibrio fischeri TaxID=668 RepID=UPI0007C4E476|nr:hypothetical protein [Aliivibrio fischeri]
MTTTLLSGNKFNSNHQTFLPDAKELLSELKLCSDVKKIMLGEIHMARPSLTRCKIARINDDLFELTWRGTTGLQKIRVVCYSENSLVEIIKRVAPQQRKKKTKKLKKKQANIIKISDSSLPLNKQVFFKKKEEFKAPTLGDLFEKLIK